MHQGPKGDCLHNAQTISRRIEVVYGHYTELVYVLLGHHSQCVVAIQKQETILWFISSRTLSVDNDTSVGVQALSADHASVLAGKEYEASSDFARLTWAAHWCATELVLSLFIHGRGNKWCPDWSWANSVDTNAALLDDLVAETACEGHNGTLGGGVVEKVRTSNISIDRCVVDDSTTMRHVGQSVLGEEEVRVNVGIESVQPLLPVRL
jgi:hypothetical protein